MKKLQLEINSNFVSGQGILNGGAIMITPPIGEPNYWKYRVQLHKKQAIIGFEKFTLIGIGFEHETDWNTNLPSNCDAETIYNHIKHNKRYRSITKEDCIEAIRMIQNYLSLDRKVKHVSVKVKS